MTVAGWNKVGTDNVVYGHRRYRRPEVPVTDPAAYGKKRENRTRKKCKMTAKNYQLLVVGSVRKCNSR